MVNVAAAPAPVQPSDAEWFAPMLSLFLDETPADEAPAELPEWHFDGPDPAEPGLPLDEWVATQASYYRALGTDAGDLIAETLAGLAGEVRLLEARTVATFRDRRDCMADAAQAMDARAIEGGAW